MAYQLEAVTMTVDMSPESMADVTAVWGDIASGKLPLLCRSDGTPVPGLSPVTEYVEYAGVLDGKPYTMTIRTVKPDFFADLARKTESGEFRLFENAADTIEKCSAAAWEMAQAAEATGDLDIDYSYAVESTVPAEYTEDGQAHCYLYVKTAR